MKLLLSVLLIASTYASAGTSDITQFDCKTTRIIENKKQTTFSFRVVNLFSSNNQIGYWTSKESDDPVKMIPANSILNLNDNWEIQADSKSLILTSDGDGCQFTTVMLYKDRNYQAGYLNIKDGGCGVKGVPAYSTVSCKVSAIK